MSTQIRQGRFNVLLTTYEYVIKDKATLSKVGVNVGVLWVWPNVGCCMVGVVKSMDGV